MRTPSIPAAAIAAVVLGLSAAHAQQQQVKPPVAQYWIDLSTHTFAGMPEMPAMPMPAMPGMAGRGGNAWGMSRAMAPGRHMDLALFTRAKPSGSDATHAIPPGLQLGASLPLVPVRSAPTVREPGEPGPETTRERPAGRLLIYWGCGEAVRDGQPRVIDLAGNPTELGRGLAGRYAPDRGARAAPGYSLWPNERDNRNLPRDASLVGEHAISGEGVPASMRFAVGQSHDLMPAIDLSTSGTLADSVALRWQPVRGALAYYLHAMGIRDSDMILWSSAETPDTGMGLFDYLPGSTIERWVREKALLPASQTDCAVPKGIFAGAKDASGMLRMIAYGPELNLAHPPRPADPRTPWEPEWALRLRVKSSTMAMLGMDIAAGARGAPAREQPGVAGRDQDDDASTASQQEKPSQGPIPGLPSVRPGDILRGIFGR